MTCIVGWLDQNKRIAYLGGDSAGVDSSYNIRVRKDIKVFEKSKMLIGYTSSFRMGQLLRFELSIPRYNELKDIYEYMCTDFIDAVRKCLKTGGYSKITNNEETIGSFLVIFKGRIFEIESDLQIGEIEDNFNSIGCGANYALGTCYALDKKFDGREAIKIALSSASRYSSGVRSPFNVIEIRY